MHVLWGIHPRYAGGVPIKIMGGTYRQCLSAYRMRSPEGWTSLVIRP